MRIGKINADGKLICNISAIVTDGKCVVINGKTDSLLGITNGIVGSATYTNGGKYVIYGTEISNATSTDSVRTQINNTAGSSYVSSATPYDTLYSGIINTGNSSYSVTDFTQSAIDIKLTNTGESISTIDLILI